MIFYLLPHKYEGIISRKGQKSCPENFMGSGYNNEDRRMPATGNTPSSTGNFAVYL